MNRRINNSINYLVIITSILLVVFGDLLVNAQDPCQSLKVPIVTCYPTDGFCGTSFSCDLKYTYNYDNVTVSPPIVQFTEYNGRYRFLVTESGTYTFQATRYSCTKSTSISLVVPKYDIIQPQCYQDRFFINGSSSSFNTSYAFSLDDQNFLAYPGGVSAPLTEDVVPVYVSFTSPAGLSSCTAYFNIRPVNTIVPQLQFVKPTCSQATGKIIVTNYQQFSSLTLKMGNLLNNLTAVNGVFSGLQVSSGLSVSYTLFAKSDLCPNTIIDYGLLYSYNPVITAKAEAISSNSCNNTHSYVTFIVSGLPSYSTNNVSVNGLNFTIGKKYTLPYDGYTISYTGDGCSTTENFDSYPDIAPVTFSSSPAIPTCLSNSTITVTDVVSSYSALTVFSSKYGTLQLNSNHQVQRGYGESISFRDKCGDVLVSNGGQDYFPQYTISLDSDDCGGNLTVIVQNYHLFDLLELSSPINTVQAVNGQFINIWFTSYALTYRVAGCSQNSTVYIPGYGSDSNMYTNYLRYNVEVVTPRTLCNQTYTILKITPIYKAVVSTVSTTINVTDSSPSSYSIPFTHPRCPNAAPVVFYTNQYKGFTAPKFSIVSRPRCKSSWAYIKLETNSSYNSVFLPYFGTVAKTNDGVYPIDPSYNSYISVGYSCGSSIYYYLDYLWPKLAPTEPNNDVPYSTTPQQTSNCNLESGSIKIDTAQYQFAQVGNVDSNHGVWSGLGSDTYYMAYNHSYCGVGVKAINVPTSSGLSISTTILKPATCFDVYQGDADFYVNVSRDGVQVPITDLSYSSGYYNDRFGVVHGAKGGVGDLTIKINYCTIQSTVNVPIRVTGPAYKANIIQYPEMSYNPV